MSRTPVEILVEGSKLLEPVLLRHGFEFTLIDSGKSSGGEFASGEFRRGGRVLEFHFRHSLGMVTYHLDSRSISHQEFMRSVLQKPNGSHYPGFSNDPLDAFRHLRLDLEEHCMDFLEGSDDVLLERIEDARSLPVDRPKLPG